MSDLATAERVTDQEIEAILDEADAISARIDAIVAAAEARREAQDAE